LINLGYNSAKIKKEFSITMKQLYTYPSAL
jgi:hypothetical protein